MLLDVFVERFSPNQYLFQFVVLVAKSFLNFQGLAFLDVQEVDKQRTTSNQQVLVGEEVPTKVPKTHQTWTKKGTDTLDYMFRNILAWGVYASPTGGAAIRAVEALVLIRLFHLPKN